QIEPHHLAHRIVRKSRLVAIVFEAVNQDAELGAPVAEVIIGNDLVPKEAQQPIKGVADDGAAQVADVHRLGDVRRTVVDNKDLTRRGIGDTEPFVYSNLL